MRKLALAVVGVASIASSVNAAQILSFEAGPISPLLPEIIFDLTNPRQLGAGPGAIGEGTNNPGGLSIQTPFVGLMAPGASPIPGGTRFADATLQLNGHFAMAPAATFAGFVGQPLTAGTFRFLSADPDGAGPLLPVVLLEGNMTASAITGVLGATTGSYVSTAVNYTGGIIAAAMAANNIGNTGETSWSLLDLRQSMAIANDGRLDRFTANASGLFNAPVIPEPTGMGAVALAGMTLCARRRRA